MRKLFPIPMIGIGTAEVESLSSYIYRLAWEHGLAVGELLRFVFREMESAELVQPNDAKLPHKITIAEMIRHNRLATTLVRYFECITSQSLAQGTVQRWSNAVGQSAHVVHNGFRWCPECFKEDRLFERPAYFRLIWHLTAITHCPWHRTPLISQCPGCGCDQSSYHRSNVLNRCQSCEKPLWLRRERLKKADIALSWEMHGADVLQLIADLAATPDVEIPADGVAQSLTRLLDLAWGHSSEENLYTLMSRDEILSIIYQQQPVSLLVARRLAYRLGISLLPLLSGNGHQSTRLLDPQWAKQLPPEMEVAHKQTKDHLKVLRCVRNILEYSNAPMSVKELAKRAGVSRGYLEYRYPVLMQEVTKRHHAYLEKLQLKKRYRAQASALAFFADEKYAEYQKSRKQAYRILRDETGLPKFMLKRAIQCAYTAFNPRVQ